MSTQDHWSQMGSKSEDNLMLLLKILEQNHEGVAVTDAQGNIQWINNAFSQITGYTQEDVSGKNMSLLNSGVQEGLFFNAMWSALAKDGCWSGELWNKNKNGEIYPEWLNISSIKNDLQETIHYIAIFTDLSDHKRAISEMNDLQQKDILTGLYNRNYFIEKVDSYITDCIEKAQEFAIIFIDLDGFKEINDSIGHFFGDKLLVELSGRLRQFVHTDYLISRFSGDEFVILYKFINSEADVYLYARKILDCIKQPFLIENTILHITANIGISRFPDNGIDAETLIRFADIAMSKAKEQTEDKICYFAREMSRETEVKFLLANHLARAISSGEMFIYYQPIFDIKQKNKMVGAEALLRWNNPILGIIPPAKFIPLAEKIGQIVPIGGWVLEEVCKQINRWKQLGHGVLPISVNISVKQLEQQGFADTVQRTLKNYNIAANLIELEITESVSSGELPTIVKNLKQLKSYGIKISMDDFGTGFSSLGQLDLFELDKLKIDKLFIDDLVNVAKRQSLVKSIIAMAKSLDLMVVAEGVETEEQLSYLKELGCQLGQGYLFSKPLPPDQLEGLLSSDCRS